MVDCPIPSVQEVPPEQLLGPLNDVEARYAPACLFVAGDDATARAGPRVAVIGSRHASVAGIEEAEKLSKALVRHGCVVVSGLAAGIDTAAHSAALAEGGRTIAVLGTPVDQVYPASNRSLQARLAVEQLVVSQFPSGQRTRPEHFVLRNRTMALFSHASIIVESGESSGTQHQGWEMLRLGRPVFLHPLLSDSPVLKWPREMMRHGARVLTTLDEVLDELPTVGSDSEAHAPF